MAVVNNSTESAESSKLASTVVAIHLITFFLGFITNGLLIYTITRLQHIRMKSVANYYILNLSIADILFISVLPFNAHSTYNHEWMFGKLVCHFANAFFHSTKFVSVFTLIVLTIDRLMATYPSKSHWRKIGIGKFVISVIWFINLPIFTVYFYYAETNVTVTLKFY